ncbi:MAG TPA: permease-like cell division protein FtsX [Rhodanobacteraceae bacterium]|nr:permease-like cell division protein FtsX [Rhodanobacteraceae bacterium]
MARERNTRPRRVAAWREQHAWCQAASLRRLGARPLGSGLTVAVMGLALALPLVFWLVLGNVQHLAGALGDTRAISVFMQPDAPAARAEAAATLLRGRSDVASVAIRTPQQGLAELGSMHGFSDALATLHYNPLPYVLLVQPQPHASPGRMTTLLASLRTLDGVDLVQDDGAWRQRLDALLGVGNRAVLLLAALLALAAVLVVGNSVRLDIQGRADEIAVLMLVGASRAFVRRPYLYSGAFYGLLGGVLAAVLAVLLELALAAPVARLAASYGGRLQLGALPWWQLLAVPLAGAALGWLGARLVSARLVRRLA